MDIFHILTTAHVIGMGLLREVGMNVRNNIAYTGSNAKAICLRRSYVKRIIT
ncbi:hypothetical protein SDC9_212286 [bioreactor metagenome]|uniref:Uncharacterized protein n=1 Tax=bioreactor metagenome TaxID=1076179 RepID=A0A645JLN4_9ZZZZ